MGDRFMRMYAFIRFFLLLTYSGELAADTFVVYEYWLVFFKTNNNKILTCDSKKYLFKSVIIFFGVIWFKKILSKLLRSCTKRKYNCCVKLLYFFYRLLSLSVVAGTITFGYYHMKVLKCFHLQNYHNPFF